MAGGLGPPLLWGPQDSAYSTVLKVERVIGRTMLQYARAFKSWVASHWLNLPLCPENQSKAVFEELRDITFPAISCISAACVRVVWR